MGGGTVTRVAVPQDRDPLNDLVTRSRDQLDRPRSDLCTDHRDCQRVDEPLLLEIVACPCRAELAQDDRVGHSFHKHQAFGEECARPRSVHVELCHAERTGGVPVWDLPDEDRARYAGPVAADDHEFARVACRHDVGGVAAHDHLQLRTDLRHATEVPDQSVLKLGMKVSLGLLHDNGDMEAVREEGVSRPQPGCARALSD
jgi:hypothetical protein